MPSPNFDLQKYATVDSYNYICLKRWQRTYELTRFEPTWWTLRSGKELQIRHVTELFSKKNAHFGHFWEQPADLQQKLAAAPISLVMSDSDPSQGTEEQDLVEKLFSTLESMEAASVLLRSIYPMRFGIYSPLILAFLQIPVASPVQHYLDICKELGVWRENFHLSSVGETDRALWVFYEYAYGPKHCEDYKPLRESFENDHWIRERQAFNVLHKFLKSYDTIRQAAFLAKIDPNLAGKIAGCEFERILRTVTGERTNTDMRKVINLYVKKQGLPLSDGGALNWVWQRRIQTVHSKKDLGKQEVVKMIKIINRILLQPPNVVTAAAVDD
jgi:hypothetical protein